MIFYLSFASPDKFLGGVFIEGESLEDAVIRTHKLNINPGGQVVGGPYTKNQGIDSKYQNRLLTYDEVVKAFAEVGERTFIHREARKEGRDVDWSKVSMIDEECNKLDD